MVLKPLLYTSLILLLFSCADRSEEVVAEVDNEKITLSDLSETTKQELFDLLNMAYEIKSKTLNDLIKQKLLAKEAKAQNMDLDQYLNSYVKQTIGSDEDSIRQMYGLAANQTSYVKNELYESSVENMEGEIALKNKLRSAIIQRLADSLYSKATIKTYIYPPKRPECVIADLCIHYRGNMKSSVNFIVASDYNCERCVTFESTLKRIFEKYQDRVKFGFVSFGDAPTLPALACEAAGRQNRFWEFHDAIFEHKGATDSVFVFNFAKSAGLNMDQFKRDLVSSENFDNLDRTINTLVKRGLFATPTIVVNDRLVYMTNSYEELSRLIENELKHE